MQVLNIDNISTLGRPSAVTIGMFDGVHVGHRHLLQLLQRQAAQQQLMPVVVTFDQHPRYVLGADASQLRLLSTCEERLDLLARCGVEQVAMVHFTPALAALSACRFVRQYLLPKLNMKALVLGYDNIFGNKQSNDFDLLPLLAQQAGFSMRSDTAVCLDGMDVSSTKIRHALAEGDIALATRMLGASYRLSGSVVQGRQVGRTLGFPTANIAVADPTKVIPKEGVYAVSVDETAAGAPPRQWQGMASLGPQPTFGQERTTLEAHLFGCHEKLYGHTLTVSFRAYLRDIRKFDTPASLICQMEDDKAQALALNPSHTS